MFEDFATLIKPQYHLLWQNYCRYLENGWHHFADNRFSAAVKQEKLRLLEMAIRKDFPLPDTLLARLQKQFVAENLSLYLLLEPVQAWRYLATLSATLSETQISEIIGRISSPAARMIMVLNDETPSTYLPMTALLSAQWLLRLRAEKSKLIKNMKHSEKQWQSKLNGLWKNAFVLLEIVKSKRLKFKLAQNLAALKLEIASGNNKQQKIDFLDRMKIFLYSIYWFVTVKKRTICKKEL